MLKVITIDALKTGMYVTDVIEQSGLMKVKSKGLVKTSRVIETLRKQGVQKLEVDLSRSKLADDETPPPPDAAEAKAKKPATESRRSIGEQLSAAQALYNRAKDTQRGFINAIKARQQGDLDSLQDVSLDIIDSVVDAPGALSCLAHINKSDDYLLEHSLNCSVLMTMFARHLKLDADLTEDLALAALLMDVGMANIPDDILRKPAGLSKPEMDVVTTHVDIGVDIIERCGDVSDLVREIVYRHHERVDGSGYPDGYSQDDISNYVMMAAIVDSYDAMITERPYQKARSSTAALKSLMTDTRYDNTLVQKFIQCIGAHPVGSLVKLSNDRLGLVIRANKTNPLSPRVVTFYHLKNAHYLETKVVDLARVETEIESSVKPDAFGLNLPQFFKDVLINQLR